MKVQMNTERNEADVQECVREHGLLVSGVGQRGSHFSVTNPSVTQTFSCLPVKIVCHMYADQILANNKSWISLP